MQSREADRLRPMGPVTTLFFSVLVAPSFRSILEGTDNIRNDRYSIFGETRESDGVDSRSSWKYGVTLELALVLEVSLIDVPTLVVSSR